MPVEKSKIEPKLTIEMRVQERIKIRQILLVLKQRLQVETDSALFLFY